MKSGILSTGDWRVDLQSEDEYNELSYLGLLEVIYPTIPSSWEMCLKEVNK